MQDGNAKQQIVEQIKNSANILVTVNSNPTVDELSAALGLTLMLNKMDKHATAVFSGEIPSALNFLEPNKTFESTTNSLRDFIIALDKEKADRLRYKVENDVVRVFITPYRTTITEKDLQFSQGDFNVELIIALGVEKRDDLDKAIVAHGRILHDASVITINLHSEMESFGGIDWKDNNASSLCEMLMSLSEALQPGLLDEQISTALLTGIVAATERFSNPRTTPRVMTMSAQLMAAGANQQLIATKLEEENALPQKSRDGSTYLKEGASSRVNQPEASLGQEPAQDQAADGALQVEHPAPEDQASPFTVDRAPTPEAQPPASSNQSEPINNANQPEGEDEQPAYDVEKELTERLNAQMPGGAKPQADIQNLDEALAKEQQEIESASTGPQLPELPSPVGGVAGHLDSKAGQSEQGPQIRNDKPAWMSPAMEPPSLGSPLTATTQQALEDAERQKQQNHKFSLLNHDSGPASSGDNEGFTADDKAEPPKDDFKLEFEESPAPTTAQPPAPQQSPAPTIAELENQVRSKEPQGAQSQPSQQDADDVSQAREAVSQALSGTEFDPAHNPLQSVGAQDLGTIDHTPPLAGLPNQVAMPNLPVFDPTATPPPVPDFNALPPMPGQTSQDQSPFIDPNTAPADQAPAPSAEPDTNNPGQFKIPGQ